MGDRTGQETVVESGGGSGLAAQALYGLLAALVRRTRRDMSLTAVATLSTLERTGPRRITELAAIEGVSQPSMTTLVANLQRDGLAERKSDPEDRRAALITITDRGATYLESRRREGAESLQRLLDRLPQPQADALARAVGALVELRLMDEAERDPVNPGA